MALIIDDRALFLHIPKTGGNFLRRVLEVLKIPHKHDKGTIGHSHALRKHFKRDFEFVAAFVRHPLSWYVSHWRYQVQVGNKALQWWNDKWHPSRPMAECSASSFGGFFQNIIETEPAYWTRMIEQYLGPQLTDGEELDFIGRFEDLHNSIVAMLCKLGYNVTLHDFASCVPSNVSRGPVPEWNRKQQDTLMCLESPGLRRLYPGGV